jgi:hypothetical protein
LDLKRRLAQHRLGRQGCVESLRRSVRTRAATTPKCVLAFLFAAATTACLRQQRLFCVASFDVVGLCAACALYNVFVAATFVFVSFCLHKAGDMAVVAY